MVEEVKTLIISLTNHVLLFFDHLKSTTMAKHNGQRNSIKIDPFSNLPFAVKFTFECLSDTPTKLEDLLVFKPSDAV